MNKNYIKRISILTIVSILSGSFVFVAPINAAAITAMSVTGTGITANSAALNSAITPTVNFTTATALTVDAQTIQITLNGMSVASGQTLASADLTLTGCATNTLEASPGTADNGIHEVTITNGAAGNDNPVILITLDSSSGTPPSCTASAKTLAIAASQLVSHDTTAGNYSIMISTSSDNGGFFFYVADENDVQITASVDNTLAFAIRNSTDTADQTNVGGAAIGPNLCDLGNLTTAGVQSCSYRLKVTTNATSGYYVSVVVDDDLNNAGDTAFITNTASGTAPSSGNEGYNILLDSGASTSGSVTECDGSSTAGNCLANGIAWNNATGTIFSNTTVSTIYSVSGPNNPSGTDTTNTALVTHRAEAATGTVAGNYNQLATYTVTPRW